METVVFGSLQSTSFSLSNLLFNNPLQPKSRVVSFVSYPYPNHRNPSLSSRIRDCSLLFELYGLRKFCLEAVANDYAAEQPSISNQDQTGAHEGSAAKDSETGNEEGDADADALDDTKMVKDCDKLIEIFMVDGRTPTDWRKILILVKEWSNIRPHFFQRCQIRADSENDPDLKHKLLVLGTKLKEIDEDVQRHNELLEVIKRSPDEISEVVAKRRKDFTEEFFAHLHTVAESYDGDPMKQIELAELETMSLDAVEAYDTASESKAAELAVQDITYDTASESKAAELAVQDIINSPSVDAACRKIDYLVEKKQLLASMVLMLTNSWSVSRQSCLTEDEMTDVVRHMFKVASGNVKRPIPKEIRILKYLITVEDPEGWMSGLNDAFTPGGELEREDADYLCTTPEKLYTWICKIVDAYNFKQEDTLIKEARDFLNPKDIQVLEEVKKLIQDNFM